MTHQHTIKQQISRDAYISTFFIDDSVLLEKIKNKIIDKAHDSSFDYKTNVKAKFTGFKSLVQEPEILEFAKKIGPYVDNIYSKVSELRDCWGNIYTKDDHTLLHHHQDTTAFCGILYLTEGGPGTYFKDFNITIEEKYGKVVLFPGILLHEVKASNLNNTRITMAFNCFEQKPWDQQ